MKQSFREAVPFSSIRPCHHLGLCVRDLDRMTAFYVKKLGFKFLKESVIEKALMKKIFKINSSCLMRYLELDGLGVELFYFLEIKLKKRIAAMTGYHHWTILVKDKDRFCQRLQRQKMKVIKIPRPHGFTYFVQDPEGNLIEVKSYQL